MTTRERIDVMIERARKQKGTDWWDGYICFGEELKLFVMPKEK